MKEFPVNLYLEINRSHFVFFVGKNDEQNNFNIVHKLEVPLNGITNESISDLESFLNILKDNIYSIEQKFNYTFKELILILDNFDIKFINLSGFKKLNGSQILRENITYILNTLKSCVDEIESKKKILHIFNSKFNLDNKKIENLPVGLFGDFYSHELSFILINKNDYKNLKNIFDKCNLMIKKILVKSFIKGSIICSKNNETFFQIKICQNSSKIIYFENSSLKSEETFNFGSDILIKDILKITSLKTETIKNILNKVEFKDKIHEDEYINKEFFINETYRKIKKKLIYDIVLARIEEVSNIIFFKNINFEYYKKLSTNIFLEFDDKLTSEFLKKSFKETFSKNGEFITILMDDLSTQSTLKTVNKIVHFGWKSEAIPISQSKKSLIARFFETIFD